MIKGCVGFSHIKGDFFGNMILVRGKRTLDIKLPYPIMLVMARLWRSDNFLGKFLYEKKSWQVQLDEAKSLKEYV